MAERARDERALGRRLLATRTARIAAGVLGLFVSAAVLAPLLANDKPYLLVAVDYGRYEAARTSLVPVVRTWVDLRTRGGSDYLARRPATSTQTWEQALDREWAAIRTRVETMTTYLDPDDASQLGRFDDGERRFFEERPELAIPIVTAAVEALEPAVPERSPSPRARGGPLGRRTVALVPARSTPLLASMSRTDAALVAGWLALLVATLCLRSSRARIGIALAVALALALVWRPLAGDDGGPASIKAGIDRGDIRVERAWFPPIPMGVAETNLAEAFRPPTWLASSRMRAGGGFERDQTRPGALTPMPVPVRVSYAEPQLNSWRRHLLGTDSLGRDLLARLLWGARSSLFVGFFAALLLTALGVVLGALAGWHGGLVDAAISRTIEIVLCFPAFVLVLCAMFFLDPRIVPPLLAVAVVIGVVGWTTVARLVRAECLRLRELEFVAAARALGITETRILLRHVLPNAIQPAIIAFSFAVGSAILTESTLSFLGFGVRAPVPSWGSLVSESGTSAGHAWIWFFPGLCIFAVVAGSNLLGEALRDALDPRHGR